MNLPFQKERDTQSKLIEARTMADTGLSIVLSSDACLSEFPSNKPAVFTNRLPEPINLSSKTYEVAVEEVHYVRALPGLATTTFIVDQPGEHPVVPALYDIASRTPASVSDFVKSMMDAMPANVRGQLVTLTYEPSSYQTKVQLAPGYRLNIAAEWRDVLGLDSMEIENVATSTKPADLRRGVYHARVYSDIGETIPVGGQLKNLLAVVTIPDGQQTDPVSSSTRVENPMYVNVARDHLQTITVYLTDTSDEPLHLRLHPTTVRLRLRPRCV